MGALVAVRLPEKLGKEMTAKMEKTLKAILAHRTVSKEVLRTTLVEVEGILNSRPTTHVSNDARSQVLANFFWRRFTKEYLPSLTERKKWKEKKQKFCSWAESCLLIGPGWVSSSIYSSSYRR